MISRLIKGVISMGSINTAYDFRKDLTVVKAKGVMTAEDFIVWAANFTPGDVTEYVLWDLLGADLCNLSSHEIRMLTTRAKGIMPRGCRTAFVLEKPCDFDIGRMLEVYNEVTELPSKFRVFREMEEAKKWLGI